MPKENPAPCHEESSALDSVRVVSFHAAERRDRDTSLMNEYQSRSRFVVCHIPDVADGGFESSQGAVGLFGFLQA